METEIMEREWHLKDLVWFRGRCKYLVGLSNRPEAENRMELLKSGLLTSTMTQGRKKRHDDDRRLYREFMDSLAK